MGRPGRPAIRQNAGREAGEIAGRGRAADRPMAQTALDLGRMCRGIESPRNPVESLQALDTREPVPIPAPGTIARLRLSASRAYRQPEFDLARGFTLRLGKECAKRAYSGAGNRRNGPNGVVFRQTGLCAWVDHAFEGEARLRLSTKRSVPVQEIDFDLLAIACELLDNSTSLFATFPENHA